jgi:hypothetical protein
MDQWAFEELVLRASERWHALKWIAGTLSRLEAECNYSVVGVRGAGATASEEFKMAPHFPSTAKNRALRFWIPLQLNRPL